MQPEIATMLGLAKRFSAKERLVLAKLLLDSVVSEDTEDDMDWHAMSLAAFEKDWDNTDDAIYDNWRVLYGVSAR
ncbi:MAG TPA: hypothetical protein PKM78_01610 [Anaerolineae bacterium]|nr:hypothetical protein [Anaerolineae bacterium]HNU02572.1 hypothetical protein [Anaerolineae bacterium]